MFSVGWALVEQFLQCIFVSSTLTVMLTITSLHTLIPPSPHTHSAINENIYLTSHHMAMCLLSSLEYQWVKFEHKFRLMLCTLMNLLTFFFSMSCWKPNQGKPQMTTWNVWNSLSRSCTDKSFLSALLLIPSTTARRKQYAICFGAKSVPFFFCFA